MLELADIIRCHGPEYLAQFHHRLLPSHRRALADIAACRTPALGGHVYLCPPCQQRQYEYHSFKNRHCPKCQNQQATRWLTWQRRWFLPTHYFLATFTLPAGLRPLARSHQKLFYRLLFQTAAALQKLALDPRFVGGQIGLIGVLHTWTRTLGYHPHLHFLIPGGGITPKRRWRFCEKDCLLPAPSLSPIFRAQFPDALKKTPLFALVPNTVWKQPWVVHCQPAGQGARRPLEPPLAQARKWTSHFSVPGPEKQPNPPDDFTRAPVPLPFPPACPARWLCQSPLLWLPSSQKPPNL